MAGESRATCAQRTRSSQRKDRPIRHAALVLALLCLSLAPVLPAQAQSARDELANPALEEEGSPLWTPRVRFGFGIAGGPFIDGVDGGLGGFSVRLGLQVNEWVAVLYQSQHLAGGFLADGEARVGYFGQHQIVVEGTLFDVLQLSVGPSLDFYKGCEASLQELTTGCSETLAPGANGRFAFAFGGSGPGERGGPSLSVDLHGTLLDETTEVSVLLGFSGEVY
ncbi:hypothetical protein JYT86_00430 [bacterium AH-315-N03]|nr:hypothetical protein [bacterium AH-315-N03]